MTSTISPAHWSRRGKAGGVMAAREVLDRLMGKAKATLAIENEPDRSEEELHTQRRLLLQRNPDLTAEIPRSAMYTSRQERWVRTPQTRGCRGGVK